MMVNFSIITVTTLEQTCRFTASSRFPLATCPSRGAVQNVGNFHEFVPGSSEA
jgi:hypothetical protein